jgi:agmatinase
MPIFIPYNFLGLPENISTYSTAKVAILPIPYDLTLSFQGGARNGPQAIIAASRQVETFDDDLGLDPSTIGIATMPELEQIVAGPDKMQAAIYEVCRRLLSDGKYVMSLGGEHSITAGLVKAHKDIYHDLSVLHIDAHSDLRDSYQGSKYSHACAMSRVAEMSQFMSVGIRSFCGEENEIKYADRIIRPAMLRNDPKIIEKIMAGLTENVYITVDLDAFDPAIMPAVGTPEPSGLTWEEVDKLIRMVSLEKKIVGADVVELSPRPGLDFADFAAARLVYKIIARSFFKE